MSFLDVTPSQDLILEFEGQYDFNLKFEQDKTILPTTMISSLEDNDDGDMMRKPPPLSVPTHPIPSMQGAFAESFVESNTGAGLSSNQNRGNNNSINMTALGRREKLIEQDVTEETHAARWKLKPGQKYHELWKLMAQISFGVYLLFNGIARDNEQVMKILQVHVDDVDEFLETTLDDFRLAQHDIEDRLKNLKLALRNISVFDALMEDRNFRLQIVEGNEKTEHVISRTASAMNDALYDVQQGVNACRDFTSYLAREPDHFKWKDKANLDRFYEAMKGNVDGWYRAFISLQAKGNLLDGALVQLGSIVAELARRAGEVSRNTRFSLANTSPTPSQSSTSDSRISRQMRQSLSKGLQSNTISIATTKSSQALLNGSPPIKECEVIPEVVRDISDNDYASNPSEFLLKPQTYSPFSSPKPKSNLKPNTMSISTFGGLSRPTSAVESSGTISLTPPFLEPISEGIGNFSPLKKTSISRKGSSHTRDESQDKKLEVNDKFSESANPQYSPHNTSSESPSIKTPTLHSRGFDSAYYSDFEKTSSQIFTPLLSPSSKTPKDSGFHSSVKSTDNSINLINGDSQISSAMNSPLPEITTAMSTPLSDTISAMTSPLSDITSAMASPLPDISSMTSSESESTTVRKSSVPEISLEKNSPVPGNTYVRDRTASNLLSPKTIKIPDQQYFRPVNASPHSPLQRPWTASPSQNPLHALPNSSSSNFSNYSTFSKNQSSNTIVNNKSFLNSQSTLRNSSSIFGKSVQSEMTIKGPKKKRSMFGWLKDQFSLSEEERMRFEEKIRCAETERPGAGNWDRGRASSGRIWLDGKRIDDRRRMGGLRESGRTA